MIISGGDSLLCSRYLPRHATLLCQGGMFCDSPSKAVQENTDEIAVACEQALRGALVEGQEKEGELATTFLEFELLFYFPCGSLLTELSDLASTFLMQIFKLQRRICKLSAPSFSLPAIRCCTCTV